MENYANVVHEVIYNKVMKPICIYVVIKCREK